MTVKIKTTFTNRFDSSQVVEIVTAVTDRMEERKNFKKSYGYMRNVEKFEREHKRTGEWNGKTILLWTDKTEYVTEKTYHLYYTNSRGNTTHKQFTNQDDAIEFTKVLDKRIERGTCGGYSLADFA